MESELSIEERCVAASYRSVAEKSAGEAKGFNLAVCVMKAVSGGLSEAAQEEVFSAIRHHQGISEPLDRAGKLALLGALGQAEGLVTSCEARANSMAADAESTAHQVESSGIQEASE